MQVKAMILALLAALAFYFGWSVQGWRIESAIQKANAQIAKLDRDYEAERRHAQEQLNIAADNNRREEHRLQYLADEERIKANEQIAISGRRADDLAARVRRAEANAATARLVSVSTQTACNGHAPAGSDGAELLNSLGIEDVREAERADKIRIALGACYAQYDAARAKD